MKESGEQGRKVWGVVCKLLLLWLEGRKRVSELEWLLLFCVVD